MGQGSSKKVYHFVTWEHAGDKEGKFRVQASGFSYLTNDF